MKNQFFKRSYKKNYLAILSIVFVMDAVYSQVPVAGSAGSTSPHGYNIKWKVDPFDLKIFIENRGQFDTVLKNNSKVLYVVALGNINAYFTANGLTYRYDEYPKPKSGRKKEGEENEADEPKARKNPEIHYLGATWEGANPSVSVEAIEKRPDYYVYPTGPASSVQVNLYKKIIYHNLYPGIDAEYIFSEGKEGIKYSLIVHPGADLSAVKLKYTGAKNLQKNKSGDIVIRSKMGDITDHAPVSFYDGEERSYIPTNYSVHGTEVSFAINCSWDKNKTLVIDPWITSPIFTGTGKVGPWDIDYDYSGNIYARGSGKIIKLNSSGSLLWTTNSASTAIAVDKATGNFYTVAAFGPVKKFSTSGALLATNTNLPSNTEEWRVVWNPCNNQLIIGLGLNSWPATPAYSIARADANLTTVTPFNPLGTTFMNYLDIAGLAMDPSGTSCYMVPCNLSSRPGNQLVKMPLPAIMPPIYSLPPGSTGYSFFELKSGYEGSNCGLNIITASRNWVYMWDGYSIKQFNKGSGTLNASNVVNPGPSLFPKGSFSAMISYSTWAGISADDCDNVYVGNKTAVNVYNSSLNFIKSIALPNTDTVTDVKIGPMDKVIYACGTSFITSIDITGPANDSIAKVVTQADCSCNGTAKATLVLCGSPVTTGVSYQWSNGQTTQSATGLCAGIHTAKIFYNCEPFEDTVKITSSALNITNVQTDVKCYGGNTGSSKVDISGGASPYSYTWNNGQVSQTATGLSLGNYTVTITDNKGCSATTTVTIVSPPALTGQFTKGTAACAACGCKEWLMVNVTGGTSPYSYSWPDGYSNRYKNQLCPGVYKINIKDKNGCSVNVNISSP